MVGGLIFLTLFPLARVIYQNWPRYVAVYDAGLMKSLYESSIYYQLETGGWIADELLYAYAGWYYAHGGNPILINPEHPPLAKYLIGFSIKYFNNEKIIAVFFGFFSLIALFLLSQVFFKPSQWALLPVTIFAWDKLFQEQLIYVPLLEVFYLTFLLLAFYFFIKAQANPYFFFLSSFFLGALWATRPWMATVPLLAAWFTYLFLMEKKISKIIFWLVSLPVAVGVLLLAYTRLFLEGWSLYKVLSIQKWLLWFHQSQLVNWGTVWPYLYLKRWYVWWGERPWLPVGQWSPFWPIFTTLALFFGLLVFFKKLKAGQEIKILCLWIIFYLAFLSVGNITSRYVFYLLPFCYLLGTYFLYEILAR